MKKSIKVLSAIFAIILLSMTLTVPVTAVEYDVEPRRVYILGRRSDVYNIPNTDTVLLSCFGALFYYDNTKTAYFSADCSLGSTIYDFQDFGVAIDGYVNCRNGNNDKNPNGSARGIDVHDIAEVDLTENIANDCISITSGNAFFVGSLSTPAVDFSLSGVAGVDFEY